MSKIIALQDTVLKRNPKDSNNLPRDKYHSIEKGKTYFVDDWEELRDNDNHLLVHLSYGAGSWYIFIPHWQINLENWEAEGDENDDNPKASEEELEPSKFDQSNIDWYDPYCQISRYFRVKEVTQGDSRRIPTDPKVIKEILNMALRMDGVRHNWGNYIKNQGYDGESAAITVTSWYRPPAINARVGGVPNSTHILGHGIDSYPVNRRIWTYQEFLDNKEWRNRALGYGAKKGFCHQDRRRGRLRWQY